ncbi:hypothetical protein ACQPZQ_21480 [Pseudonocardia sp. CA-142604]|uniref:hypothetical protein n=1 Tax=Pseudonocardia sp. CA-142604 TaxID=3240024 RepID=UPI003D8C29A2
MTAGTNQTATARSAPESGPVDAPAAPPHPVVESSPPGGLDTADTLPRVLRLVGSIVAPTTLLTGLLFYFGLLYAVGYYRHLGLNFTALDLPAQAYLINSADAAVVPLALLAVATLVAISIHRLPVERWSGRPRRVALWGLLPAAGLLGTALLALVTADAIFALPVFPASFAEARGVSLTVGVLLLGYAARLWRLLGPARPGLRTSDPLAVARAGCVFLLVSIGLFWTVGTYAVGVGIGKAQAFAADLACVGDVAVYSETSLNLSTAGLTEEPAPNGAGFRYPGLKLVPQAGSRYFLLLPADWAQGHRPAILLPRSDSLRLEFLPLPADRVASC